MQNYETFGRSRTKTMDFQTFQDKLLRKEPRNDQNNYIQNFSAFQKASPQSSQPWGQPQAARKGGSFLNFEPKSSYYAPPPTFQTISPFQQSPSPFQQSPSPFLQNKSQLMHRGSPSPRDFSPYSSLVGYSPDSQLSKSRTKSQRKKSDRPFYDASKLTIKKESNAKEELPCK